MKTQLSIDSVCRDRTFVEMIWCLFHGGFPTPSEARLLDEILAADVDGVLHESSALVARTAIGSGASIASAMAAAVLATDSVSGDPIRYCMELLELIRDKCTMYEIHEAIEDSIDEYTFEHGRTVPGFSSNAGRDRATARLLERIRDVERHGAIEGRCVKIGTLIEASLALRNGRPCAVDIHGACAIAYVELGFCRHSAAALFTLSRSARILALAAGMSGPADKFVYGRPGVEKSPS